LLSEHQDGAAPARQRHGPVKLDCQAQQILELRPPSGTEIIDLVGKLQGVGFLVGDFEVLVQTAIKGVSMAVYAAKIIIPALHSRLQTQLPL